MIRTKRVYDDVEDGDGCRVLVDGMWPRGVRKEDAGVERWLRGVAPGKELREWFGHDPERWDEFRRRYAEELDRKDEEVAYLVEQARTGTLTLVYAASDTAHNNAVALAEYLRGRL